ncbi:MAG: hypothetical protein R3C68_13700 [Myxococcota bacterium]
MKDRSLVFHSALAMIAVLLALVAWIKPKPQVDAVDVTLFDKPAAPLTTIQWSEPTYDINFEQVNDTRRKRYASL